ncbi:thiol reductant ABC exporter subunit CydD [Streptomyces clavuligerus]|uniref:thiol reductant ABC exporter subunit CydD n=1 Tax=Streptomyces clavuligerus TaxID=1901 RepID=UPI00020D9580|nr:thiol reductant ABC exporter subunit CydD [Streptomyces clavuligerus]ANW19303.1 ABC transporter [Streptomyces clavuligerus]AXU13905.1 thiol reductant ABC exporter subunit CydD [Streptomyces clavuligerus]MBY6303874.1 thiol reductant ABC exporter subunit CydD [Streptomyces clavuligerus]QCS06678.1 thiol reductant ABC exporter subunit CydD [Streptomyces clavuligerus]QPJ93970.1 thiol reductant ABC exporter subunit CydD [Streptomyces clavuligerus]
MKPIDPRLLRHARSTRGFLLAVVLLGLVGAALVVAQAMLIAEAVVGSFEKGLSAADLMTPLALLALVAVGRAAVSWLTELAAHRASAAVKSELREKLLAHTAALGPGYLTGQRTGSLVALATRGIDALDDYFSRYLPQLGLAVVVPVAVLARIVTEDWVSAAIIVGTLPLIPVFMVLIGWATQNRMDRQWRLLSRLSGHFLDVVAGLPTLKVFGRARAQAESIRTITSEYRRATLRTLRIAFISSFALELLSTLSVALVAVTIGMRLVHGDMDLYTGLVILILAPEAYLPLRMVGTQYHAAAEGLAAAEEIFTVLETEPREQGGAPVPDRAGLELDGVTVRHPGRAEPSLDRTSLTVAPGETVALVGPSGIGKSTLLDTVLGFTAPDGGRVLIGGTDLTDLDLARWHERIAWVPQRPCLFAGTIADNVRLARPDADDHAVRAALRDAGAEDFVTALPQGADTPLGEDGAGLSAGQRQRLALARAFLADRPVLLLDEPTAALDGETEAQLVEAVGRLTAGRTVLLVVHRPALLAVADRVVTLTRRPSADGSASGAPDADRPDDRHEDRPARADDPWAPELWDLAKTPPGEGAETPFGDRAETPEAAGAPAPGGSDGRRDAVAVPALTRVRDAAGTQRGRYALALLLGSLALGSAVGLMAVSGYLISRASEQPPVLYLMMAVTATRAFGIGRAVFRYAERLVSHDAVLRTLGELRVAVYSRLERISPAGLRRSRRGDLLSRLVTDVDALQDYWLRWLLPAGAALLVSAASVGFTAWLLPEAGALLAAGLLCAGVGVPLISGAVARRAEPRLAPARGELAARLVDLLRGTAELTVAGAMPARRDGVREADRRLTRIAARTAAATALGSGLTSLACGLTVVLTTLAGIRAVSDGRLDGVALAVVVLTPLAAFEAVNALPLAVQYRQRVRRSAERVYEVLDAPVPVAEPEHPAAAPASVFPVEVRGLRARHAGAARDAVDGIDLTLTEGSRIAVVGASGSGKTTLAQVLLRFLDAREGSYTLGGVPAAALDGDEVRARVGLCAQDAHLFDSSVRENLRIARPDATGEELRRALAGARLLEWVDALPEGMDTLVGEHGARLSGGQRQRLALARALLADFPVLVLDEPAEHLDLETADALTADLLAAGESRTARGGATVLITHRLRGLDTVDEIVVLEDGRVAQRGPYALLSTVDGPLRRMLERERTADRLGREAVVGERPGAPDAVAPSAEKAAEAVAAPVAAG